MVPLPHLSPPMWIGQDPLSVSLWASSLGGLWWWGKKGEHPTTRTPQRACSHWRYLSVYGRSQCILESLLIKSLELLNRWESTKDSLQPTKYFYNSFIEDSAVSLSTWIWDFSRQGWTNSVQTVFKGKFFYWCEMCYMQNWPCSLARQALFFVEEWNITRRLLCFLFRWLYYWGLSNIEKFFKNSDDCFQDGEKHS